MAGRFTYLERIRDTSNEFWSDQIGNWQRVWDRVQTDNYTFGNWIRDAIQTWDTWAYGALRFASLPSRQFQGVVPTLVLMSDGQGDPGPKGEVAAPDGMKYGNAGAVQATPFTVREFDDAFRIEARANDESKTVVVQIVAKGGLTFQEQAKAGNFLRQSASALVFQGTTPIANVLLSFV